MYFVVISFCSMHALSSGRMNHTRLTDFSGFSNLPFFPVDFRHSDFPSVPSIALFWYRHPQRNTA